MRVRTVLKAAIAVTLAWGSTAAQAEWHRATSRHFIVYSDGSPQELRHSTEMLERYDALLRLMSISKPDEDSAKLVVYQLPNEADVAALSGISNAAGFYTPGPLGPVAVAARTTAYNEYNGGDFKPLVVLFHEYAHHYMLQNYTAAYPPWFVEGYAELLGATTFEKDGSANIGNSATYRFWGLHYGQQMPIRDLLDDSSEAQAGRLTDPFYAEAWLLVHYLVFNDARSPQLHKYLAAFSQGTKSLDAAQQAFGDLDKLYRELVAYRDRSTLPGLHIAQQNAADLGPIAIDTPDPAEQAIIPARLLYMRGLGSAEIPKFVAGLRKNAAAAPKDPITLDLLWRGELAAKDFDAADHAADALLAVKPHDAQALLGKGLIAMQRLEDAKDYAAPKWAAARKFVIDANEAQTGNAETLFAYYQSFVRAHLPPTETAKLGLMRAFELEPQSPPIRLTLAGSLVGDRRYSDARTVLKPAAYSVHDLRSAASAQKMLGMIGTVKDGDPLPMALPEIDKTNDAAKKS